MYAINNWINTLQMNILNITNSKLNFNHYGATTIV